MGTKRRGPVVKVIANQSLCSGHARCAAAAPEFFELTDDGYIGFAEKTVPPELEAAARRGVRACPERALTFVETSTPASTTASASNGE